MNSIDTIKVCNSLNQCFKIYEDIASHHISKCYSTFNQAIIHIHVAKMKYQIKENTKYFTLFKLAEKR